jgi:hypothetical protein
MRKSPPNRVVPVRTNSDADVAPSDEALALPAEEERGAAGCLLESA